MDGVTMRFVKMGSKAMKIVAISLIWTILGCEMRPLALSREI